MHKLEGIDHVALAVSDVDRSVKWYQRVLGLERRFEATWGDEPAMLGVGDTMIALSEIKGASPKPPPGEDVLAMRHLAFRAGRATFEAAQGALERMGIAFEFENHQRSHSIYFRDPDGHLLEITTYEF